MVQAASAPRVDVPSPVVAVERQMGDSAARSAVGGRGLFLVALLAVLGALTPVTPEAVRLPIGLAAVLFAPGYALIAALLPNEPDLDWSDRFGLALGASLALIAVEAFLLDRSPWRLTADAIRGCSTVVSLILLGMAALRRQRGLGPSQPTAPAPRGRPSRALRFTQAIVVTNLVVAALAYAVTIGGQPAPPTEFYVVGIDGTIGGYPRQVAPGEPMVVRLGVNEPGRASGRYRVAVTSNEKVLATAEPVTSPGARWESDLSFRLDTVGPSQEVDIVLERSGAEKPIRTLRLWVDVTARSRTP